MKTNDQLKLFASFWTNYVEKFGFRFWFLHTNTGGPQDHAVHPALLELGIDPNACCYEIALSRSVGCRVISGVVW
jgi:hypothetical protein